MKQATFREDDIFERNLLPRYGTRVDPSTTEFRHTVENLLPYTYMEAQICVTNTYYVSGPSPIAAFVTKAGGKMITKFVFVFYEIFYEYICSFNYMIVRNTLQKNWPSGHWWKQNFSLHGSQLSIHSYRSTATAKLFYSELCTVTNSSECLIKRILPHQILFFPFHSLFMYIIHV